MTRMPYSKFGKNELPSRLGDNGNNGQSSDIEIADQIWAAFLSFVENRPHSDWVFRGVASTTHGCVPSVGRSDNYTREREQQIFNAFKRSARQFSGSNPTNDWEWLALAQHHGLPTRLLDWTTNPLVACFFAVTSFPANDSAVIYAYDISKSALVDIASEGDPFSISEVRFYMPARFAPRIVNQRGLFSVHANPDMSWTPPELQAHSFSIPAKYRTSFRFKLFKLGVDAGNIMADLDGLCQTLKWRYIESIGVGPAMIG